jgi:hypothetical protein
MKLRQLFENRNVKEILTSYERLSDDEKKQYRELITTKPTDVLRGVIRKAPDGNTYRWQGAQWADIRSGKIADKITALSLHTQKDITDDVANLYQQTKQLQVVDDVTRELRKKSKDLNTKKVRKPFDTGLTRAMQSATGRRGPSKAPGADPQFGS